jgi:ATP-dependent Lon protease
MFIATANVADTIPGPLLDRMEVIRFDGYTTEEKVAIAAATCGRASATATACGPTRSRSPTTCCARSSTEYTREAGVRNLERELGTVLRKTATKIASGQGDGAGDDRPRRVRDALGRQKFFQESAIRTATPVSRPAWR